MKTIWVIEQGSYSDYRVVGVYTSKEKAERVVEGLKAGDSYDEPTIAEWPLDPGFTEINAGMTQWRILMLKDGTVERADKSNLTAYDLSGSARIWERTQAPAYKGKGIPDALDATVWAKNKKHAIKSTNEIRAQMIADGRWK